MDNREQMDKALEMMMSDMDDMEGKESMAHSMEECHDPMNHSEHNDRGSGPSAKSDTALSDDVKGAHDGPDMRDMNKGGMVGMNKGGIAMHDMDDKHDMHDLPGKLSGPMMHEGGVMHAEVEGPSKVKELTPEEAEELMKLLK